MRFPLMTGPFMLLLWQTAPVSVQRDSVGTFQLAVGWGAGQFEDRDLSCSGDVIGAVPARFNGGGVQLDYRPSAELRVSGFGGVIEVGGTRSAWGGVQTAFEGRRGGVGFGLAHTPFEDLDIVPSGYIRVGSRDGTHFRLDVFHPTPLVGATGDVVRIGAGFNQGLEHRTRGFFGFSVGPYSDESHVGGFFGELEVPVGARLDLSVGGSWRPSHQYFDGGLRGGVRYHLGR